MVDYESTLRVPPRKPLRIEDGGGNGTKCSHWEEDSFDAGAGTTSFASELMTGWFEAGSYQPISRVTAGGLEDLGYVVNYDAADEWPGTRRRLAAGGVLTPDASFSLDDVEDLAVAGCLVD